MSCKKTHLSLHIHFISLHIKKYEIAEGNCRDENDCLYKMIVYVGGTDVNIHGWRIGVDVCRRVVSFKSTAEQQLHSTENWCPCKK